jgi:hypothetical protein
MKTDSKTLDEIKRLHDQYVQEVEFSGIKPLSIEIYKSLSNFVPGGKLKKISEDNLAKEQNQIS